MSEEKFEWDEEISALIMTYPKAMQRFANKIEKITKQEITNKVKVKHR